MAKSCRNVPECDAPPALPYLPLVEFSDPVQTRRHEVALGAGFVQQPPRCVSREALASENIQGV